MKSGSAEAGPKWERPGGEELCAGARAFGVTPSSAEGESEMGSDSQLGWGNAWLVPRVSPWMRTGRRKGLESGLEKTIKRFKIPQDVTFTITGTFSSRTGGVLMVSGASRAPQMLQ